MSDDDNELAKGKSGDILPLCLNTGVSNFFPLTFSTASFVSARAFLRPSSISIDMSSPCHCTPVEAEGAYPVEEEAGRGPDAISLTLIDLRSRDAGAICPTSSSSFLGRALGRSRPRALPAPDDLSVQVGMVRSVASTETGRSLPVDKGTASIFVGTLTFAPTTAAEGSQLDLFRWANKASGTTEAVEEDLASEDSTFSGDLMSSGLGLLFSNEGGGTHEEGLVCSTFLEEVVEGGRSTGVASRS